jgi:hypothetical protein
MEAAAIKSYGALAQALPAGPSQQEEPMTKITDYTESTIEEMCRKAAEEAVAQLLRSQPHLGDPRIAVTMAEGASMLAMGSSSFAELVRHGVIETIEYGRSRRPLLDSIRKFAEKHRKKKPTKLANPPLGRGRPPRSEAISPN